MSDRRLVALGRIHRLQVQRDRVRNTSDGSYRPQHIVPVEVAVVGPPGVIAALGSEWLVDVHHATHPLDRGDGRRRVSVGFTSHYRRMRDRYGLAPIGIAAENIIVGSDTPVTPDQVGRGLVIRTASGDEVELTDLTPARACAEFASFMLGHERAIDRADLADELAFLSDGTRGFVGSLDQLDRAYRIRTGDLVYARELPG